MKKQPLVILPLATALASLTGEAVAATTPNTDAQPAAPVGDIAANEKIEPNVIFKAGDDLLGLLVTTQADGTVVAQHSSHYSHSSHSSHRSHTSSRF